MSFHVVAMRKGNKASLVMVRKGQVTSLGTAFTVWRALAKDPSGLLNAKEAAAAVKWVKKKGWKPRLVRNGLPFIDPSPGVELPGDRVLLMKLNRVGREMKRLVVVKSGYRSHYQQWELRMKFLRGEGNLAARCCLKYDQTIHSWQQCGKQSQSNHSLPPKGRAVDCGLLLGSGYVSIGNVHDARVLMKKNGLCLPVPGEAWHVQAFGGWAA